MPTSLLLNLLGYALAAAGVVGSIYAGYSHIKHIGYIEAETKYELVIKEYEDKRNAKINRIADLSEVLVSESRKNNAATTKSIAAVLEAAKTKPLVVVKDGECTPSQTFSDSILTINKRINQSILESQK